MVVPSNRTAGTIINNQRWLDTDGLEIAAGRGGHLSKINGTWYWIGTNPDIIFGGDLHLYSSDTFGEGTWAHHGVMVSADPGATPARNCRLVKHPDGHYVIVGKGNLVTGEPGIAIYSAAKVDGPYTRAPTPNVGAYQRLPTFDNAGSAVPGAYRHKFGGGSLFVDDDGSAYYITSRKNLDWKIAPAGTGIVRNNRNVGIYKLRADWLDFEENTAEVYWGPNMFREAMFLFKRNNTYYMSSSHTSKWRPSDTYYRTAAKLSGPWSDEAKVAFVPALNAVGRSVRSHGCQFRYFIDVGDNEWMFGGDRYPVEDPETWPDPDKGRHIRMPVVWHDDVPTVYWRHKWDVGSYQFTNTTSEPHDQVPGVKNRIPR